VDVKVTTDRMPLPTSGHINSNPNQVEIQQQAQQQQMRQYRMESVFIGTIHNRSSWIPDQMDIQLGGVGIQPDQLVRDFEDSWCRKSTNDM